MEHVEGQFTGAKGLEIYWQAWRVQAPTRATVVISHGAGEHSSRYQHVAARFAPLGYPVYALDHRGHGHSAGRRALVDRLDNAAADLDVLIVGPREFEAMMARPSAAGMASTGTVRG